jgi:hypothetical protein
MATTTTRKTRLTQYQILLLQEALEQFNSGLVDEASLLALRQALNFARNIVIER